MRDIFISEKHSIYNVMKKLQKTGEKCLIVVNDKKKLLGTITDGDVRRVILNKIKITAKIKNIYNKNCYFLKSKYLKKQNFSEILKSKNFPIIPIVDKSKIVIDYISLKKIGKKTKIKPINIEVIVMAGGAGARLKPLTNVLPKPLIPLDNKTVIENIIDNFIKYKINKFIISVNFKSRIIKAFFRELQPKYQYKFLEEKKPLGTAGCLAYLQQKKREDYIITNCDTLINFDCNEFYEHHKKNKNDITILASIKKFKIPYGLCKINNKGLLENIIEKPSQHHLVNTGIYIINNQIFKYIKKGKRLNFNELILIAKKKEKKISIFPISENSWFDTGQWDEYIETKKIYDKK